MKLKLTAAIAVAVASALPAFAGGTINVLWYTGGVEANAGPGSYVSAVNNLVSQEQNPAFNLTGSVNTWNVTFWSSGAKPAGTFNVLVAASPEGGWLSYPDYSALIAGAGTAADYGNRVMLSGQDADWHYINGPGSTPFDGPSGFLIDAINWAGSGTGMGGVFLGADTAVYSIFPGSGSSTITGTNSVLIPAPVATFPINTNLTSDGLSNWNTSAHRDFSGYDSSIWEAINLNGNSPTVDPITIVTKATAGGGTTPGGATVPDSGSTLALSAMALALLGFARRFLS